MQQRCAFHSPHERRGEIAKRQSNNLQAVLDCEIPELVEVIAGRVIIPDRTLIPPPATVQLTPSCTSASAIKVEQQSRFCPTPTASCATSANQSPDLSTMCGPFVRPAWRLC
jgi:hypothetical protein